MTRKSVHTITLNITIQDVDPTTYGKELRSEHALADCLRQWMHTLQGPDLDRLRDYYGIELRDCSVARRPK